MPELGTFGSVRGVPGNGHSYRNRVLEEIGARDGLSVPQLLGRLHDELESSGRLDEAMNFTSFLRVSCMRYLQLQLAGRIPPDALLPLGSLDPAWVLAAERRPSA